jgi:hypothetical protein
MGGGLLATYPEASGVLPPLPDGYPVRREQVGGPVAEVDAAVADPASRRPPFAVRTAAFAERIARINAAQFGANNPVLDFDYLVQADGRVVVDALILSGQAPSVLDFTVTGQDDATGWGALNAGATLIAGAWLHESHEVHRGDLLNLRFATATQATLRLTFREGD